MLIRRETEADIPHVHDVTAAAFASAPHSAPPTTPGGPPGEVTLLELLRSGDAWLPALSFVAVDDAGGVIGHVVCTRGTVADVPALGLGPVSVAPAQQGGGVGTALMHAVLGAADALDEPLVALLGEPAFYRRFGFRTSTEYGVSAPTESWGAYFQVRTLATYRPTIAGRFTYAGAFDAF